MQVNDVGFAELGGGDNIGTADAQIHMPQSLLMEAVGHPHTGPLP